MNERNLSLLCDYYELTMSNGYFKKGMADRIAYFDVFFRTVPDGGGFAVAAGLEQIVDYINNHINIPIRSITIAIVETACPIVGSGSVVSSLPSNLISSV